MNDPMGTIEPIKDIIKKSMPKTMQEFIAKHRLSNEEFAKLKFETEITDEEYFLIESQATSKFIEQLKVDKENGTLSIPEWVMDEVIETHGWIKNWVDGGFKGLKEAMQHLNDVNNWHLEHHGEPYYHGLRLFNWQNDMRDKIILKYKLGSREDRKAIKDKKKEKDKITKRFGTYEKD